MVGNGDESTDSDDDESEGENHAEVSSKLRRERLEASGKYFQDLAGSLSNHIDEDDNEAFEDSLSRITLGAHKVRPPYRSFTSLACFLTLQQRNTAHTRVRH